VVAEADSGATVGKIAKLLRVSVSFVSKALGRPRESGETTARPQRCQLTPKLAPPYEAIRASGSSSIRMRRSARCRPG
jgi:transposase